MATSLFEDVRAWMSADPSEENRDELAALLAAAETGDSAASAELEDRFAGTLQFGTAGLRGVMEAGPNRMNSAVVRRAAAGLVAWLKEKVAPDFVVVIGYDARYHSEEFARDTAAIVTAAGGTAHLMPGKLPTPLLAYAVRKYGADAGVMVTASHNPPKDNGYKVYLGGRAAAADG
ncbi:phospho-sugar mutase, partial [Trueperella pyogenes]|nr:phospho-sugar mutase [Trueperella pyogenes]